MKERWKVIRRDRKLIWIYPWIVFDPEGIGYAFYTWEEAYQFADRESREVKCDCVR